MNTTRCAGALALAAAVVLASSFRRPDVSAQSAQPALNGPQYLAMKFRPEKDVLPVPRRPGLGVEIDEGAVRWLH